jgi:hypothetical protein
LAPTRLSATGINKKLLITIYLIHHQLPNTDCSSLNQLLLIL